MTRLPTLGLPFALAACVSTAAPVPRPLDLIARHPVTFEAEVASGPSSLSGSVPAADHDARTERVVEVRCRFVPLSEPEARALGLMAVGRWSLDREVLARRLDRDGLAGRGTESTLSLYAGQTGSLQVVEQRAYVRSFEITAVEETLLADPVVDVLTDGGLLVVSAEPLAAGRLRLTLALTLSELQGLDPVEVRVPGGLSSVTIQQPVTSEQRLSTEVELGADETLLLVALAQDGDGRLAVLVDAREMTPAER